MLAALLLQAAFLPAPPAGNSLPDAAYGRRLQALVHAGEIPTGQVPTLRPVGPAQEAALVEMLLQGGPREVKVAALLAAGTPADSQLARALFYAACEVRDEGAALAALLAADGTQPEDLPGLAYLALSSDRPLSVRAAVTGRLLEADCAGAWPIARSILRTGTAEDEDAPWADWERNGRYELPKRLLTLSVDAWFEQHEEAASGFEPNAAWADQVEQLRRMEPTAVRVRQECLPRGNKLLEQGLAKVLLAAADGDETALRTLAILSPHTWVYMKHPAEIGEARALAIARQALATVPQ